MLYMEYSAMDCVLERYIVILIIIIIIIIIIHFTANGLSPGGSGYYART